MDLRFEELPGAAQEEPATDAAEAEAGNNEEGE
jgi:hypothetical protein